VFCATDIDVEKSKICLVRNMISHRKPLVPKVLMYILKNNILFKISKLRMYIPNMKLISYLAHLMVDLTALPLQRLITWATIDVVCLSENLKPRV